MLVFKPCENLLPPKFFTPNSKPHLLHHHHHHHHRHVKLHFPLLMAHFKSTQPSSPLSSPQLSDSSPPAADSSSVATTTTTTVGFLMDSCGLSYVQALQVIRKKPTVLQDGGRNARSVIAYFESIGLSKTTHISKAISKFPRLLVSDVEKTLKPKIQLLQDFGFPDSDIVDLIASKPSIMLRSLKNYIKPGLELIKSFVKTDADLIKAIKQPTSLFLLRSIRQRNYIEPNMDVLRHHGVPDSEILHLILKRLDTLMSRPEVFKRVVQRIVSLGFKPGSCTFTAAVSVMSGMKKATWDSKIDLLKGLGWSDEQILYSFRSYPTFLRLSRENLQESIEFYVKTMNWDSSILSQYPAFIISSLKRRVIPRFAVLKSLMSKEIIKENKQFKRMLRLTETQFLSRYVFKYQEQLPYLYEVYNKEFMLGCEKDNGEITNQQEDHGDVDVTV